MFRNRLCATAAAAIAVLSSPSTSQAATAQAYGPNSDTQSGDAIFVYGNNITNVQVGTFPTQAYIYGGFAQAIVPQGYGLNVPLFVTENGVVTTTSLIKYPSWAPTQINLRPRLSSIYPAPLRTAGGDTFTIFGTNVGTTTATKVVFAGTTVTPTIVLNDRIIGLTPPLPSGMITLEVDIVGAKSSTVVSAAPPSINAINPVILPTSGGTLQVVGQNFGTTGTRVLIGGQEATITSRSHTMLTAIVPPGSGVNKSVSVASTIGNSNILNLSYSPPSITAITPNTGNAGTTITISGNNFSTNTTATIRLGSASATVLSQNNNTITALVPSGSGTGIPVRIIVDGQASNSSATFSYLAGGTIPVVTALVPGSGPTSGGTAIDIFGNNFGSTTPTVTIGGSPATVTSFTITRISAITPAGQGRDVAVQVQAGPNVSDGGMGFDYDPPVVSSVLPTTGVRTSGGTTFSISGNNFGTGIATVVTVNGSVAPVVTQSHTNIIAQVPAGSGAEQIVLVSVAGQQSTSTPAFLSYAPPTNFTLLPTSGSTAGGTTVVLTGESYGPVSASCTVTVGGQNATILTRAHNQITFLTPPGTGTNNDVIVTVDGQQSAPITWAYNAPMISGISPSFGPTAGGTTVTISGSNFGTGGSISVAVGATTAGIVQRGHNSLTIITPPGVGTNLPVKVYVDDQESNSQLWDYNAPSVFNIFPLTGPTVGGTTITLTGNNFGGTTASVTIGGKPATVLSVTHTNIVAVTPPGEGVLNTIQITVPDGRSINAGDQFSYDPPSISSIITLGAKPTSGGNLISIVGANFGTTPTVSIGGSPATVLSSSQTSITVYVPAGQGTALPVVVTSGFQINAPGGAAVYSYDAPAISSITPSFGATSGGYTVDISGSSFGTAATINFGGSPRAVTLQSHTLLRFTVPAGTGAGIPITVSVAGQNSNSVPFSYNPPAVASISPTTGPTAGGTTVTIFGNDFGASGALVNIGGSSAIVTSQTHTQLTVTTPAGQGTSLTVTVQANDGRSTTAAERFSYAAPILTSVSPTTGSTSGGSIVTLLGSNFGLNPFVTIGGNVAPIQTSNHSQVTAFAPAGQGLNQPVVVTAASQQSNALPYSYAAPVIDSIVPLTGSTAGGYTIGVYGSNFGTSSVVTFDGVPQPLNFQSHTALEFAAPAGLGTGKPVVVSTGGQDSNSTLFSYDPPTISSITPISGLTSGGYQMIIAGASFGASGASATIGSTTATLVSHSHSSMTVNVPSGTGVNRPVRVRSADGRISATNISFSYNAPGISSVSPTSGPTQGGTTVTISGSNFGTSGPISVTINGAAATIVNRNHTQLQVISPAGLGANANLQVVVDGQSASTTSFGYDGPTITTISPATAPTSGGTTMTIFGNSFGNTTASVTVGGVSATVVSVSHTQVTVLVPAGQGTGKSVVLTAPDGRTAVSGTLFNYAAPLLSTLVTSGSKPTVGGNVFSLIGQNFGTSPLVTIGGSSAVVQSVSHTSITAIAPVGSGRDRSVQVFVASQPSNILTYSYDPPVITSVTPTTGPLAGGPLLTVVGQNFGPGNAVVTLGSRPVAPVTLSHTVLTGTIPAGFGINQPVYVSVDGQATSAPAVFSYDPPTTTTISPAGDAPATSSPLARFYVNYGDGSTSGGSSITSVTLSGSVNGLTNLPTGVIAEVYWQIETNRSFTNAQICVEYNDLETSGMLPQGLVLYTSQTPNGPWTPVANQVLDTVNHTICGEVSHFSYFILSGPVVPVRLSLMTIE